MLPDSLTDAIAQASESTVTAMEAGSDRIVVSGMHGVCSAPQESYLSHFDDGSHASVLSQCLVLRNTQAEVLLGEFWDPASGAVFAEEGDQQRFWKLTRKFAENLVTMAGEGTRVRAVGLCICSCSAQPVRDVYLQKTST